MFYLYLQSSSASRQPKISNLMFLANPVYRVRSHPSAWHLKTFQWHGWTRSSNNSIFLFEIYQFFVGKYSTFIYNPQALLESEKIPTLSVSLTLYTEYEEIHAWHLKKAASDSSGQNSKYCKETVKWRTANVFTVKQLTICPGWLLRKTILEGFQWSGNFVLQEIGSRRALHQGWKWALTGEVAKALCSTSSITIWAMTAKTGKSIAGPKTCW